jgi:hypothetical protein
MADLMKPLLETELLTDLGAAAQDSEFFRSPEFYAAEGVSHSLQILAPDGVLSVPLVVSPIGDGHLDASSPYGFPGLRGPGGRRLDPSAIDLSSTGLVSVFLRHALGTPPLQAASRRNQVQIADPASPLKLGSSDRHQINQNEKRGVQVEVIPGPQTLESQRVRFYEIYTETMARRAAIKRYRYKQRYFEQLLESELSWLALALEPGGEISAASLVVRSDGMLHYYLSGTSANYYQSSPMRNILGELWKFAKLSGLPLNLGGGMSVGDGLEAFKGRFANHHQHFHTSELIGDPEVYANLSKGIDAGGFFPAYRAPAALERSRDTAGQQAASP